MKPKALALALALAAPSSAWSAPTASTPLRVGVAAAVRGPVSAQPSSGAVGKVVQSGLPIHMGDKITTGRNGRLQILLLDETVFTIGPDSTLVIDEFVYDPASGSGKVAASVLKGMFRFVSGKVAKKDPESMKVKLPVGTIGIRGTIVSGRILDGNRAFVMWLQGAGYVQNEAGIQHVRTVGHGTYMEHGRPPEPFRQAAPNEVKILRDGLDMNHQTLERGDMKELREGDQLAHNGMMDGEPAPEGEQPGEENSFFMEEIPANQIFNDATRPVQNGLAKWEDVLRRQTGEAHYVGNNPGGFTQISCNGAACGTGVRSDLSLMLAIDYGKREIGGGNSKFIVGPTLATGGTISTAQNIAIGAVDFQNTGPAVFLTPLSGQHSGAVALFNFDNRPAEFAAAYLNYDDGTGNRGEGGVVGVQVEGPIP